MPDISDYELVYMVRHRSDAAYRILYERYAPMIWKKAHETAKQYNRIVSADEFYSESLVVFTKVVNTYRFDLQVEFSTYLYSAVEYSCGRMVRTAMKEHSWISNLSENTSLETIYNNLPDMNLTHDPVCIAHASMLEDIVEDVLRKSSELEKMVMNEFLMGAREADIMRKCNLTRRKVDYIRGKFQKRIQNMLYLKDFN